MSEITVVAQAKAQPGREEEIERALRTNAEASRQEGSCVSYQVLRGDEGVFMTVERWSDRPGFDQHMTMPHVQTLLQTIGPMLAEAPQIRVLREV